MVGIIPYAGLDIAAFELMRERLHERYDSRPPPQHLLLAGMLSSTGAQLVAYPLGLIRTRLQVTYPSFCLQPRSHVISLQNSQALALINN